MKKKILKALKDSEKYVSGEELSNTIGVTRTAIWKHIKQLKEEAERQEQLEREREQLEQLEQLEREQAKKDLIDKQETMIVTLRQLYTNTNQLLDNATPFKPSNNQQLFMYNANLNNELQQNKVENIRESIKLLTEAEYWPKNITVTQWGVYWKNKYQVKDSFDDFVKKLSS